MATLSAIPFVLALAAPQLVPPNLVENGDARGGASSWEPVPRSRTADLSKDALVESRDDGPCFVMRNGASWTQRVNLLEDYAGKFLLIIGRGSSERVYADDNITGLPYLWARLVSDAPPSNETYLQGMALRPAGMNAWGTMHGIFRIPKGVRAIILKLGQAERRGTPQNGSAARVRDVEMRLFDTRADAAAYVAAYDAQHAR